MAAPQHGGLGTGRLLASRPGGQLQGGGAAGMPLPARLGGGQRGGRGERVAGDLDLRRSMLGGGAEKRRGFHGVETTDGRRWQREGAGRRGIVVLGAKGRRRWDRFHGRRRHGRVLA